jgi:predicted Zn-dependent protease
MKNTVKYIILSIVLLLASCNVLKQINLFSLEDEKNFGKEMYAQIQNAPKDYPLVDEAKNPALYGHIKRIMKNILNTGQVNYTNDFDWSIKIIDADVLNAFACPGGKMYVYTGLIKYLDNESQLAGVMAHEISHVHWRHSTRQMTQQYGMSLLQQMVLGENPNQMLTIAAQLSGQLGGLAFSRSDESEADITAVKFLSHSEYNPLGVAGFFEKLQADGQASESLSFLSTHPSPSDRINAIHKAWELNGSKKGNNFADRYAEIKKSVQSIKK